MSITEIREALKKEIVVIGTKDTIKNLKKGKLEKIFLSSNCPKSIKADIISYSKLSKIPVTTLKKSNEEIGTLCKKPFSISVLSILKKK